MNMEYQKPKEFKYVESLEHNTFLAKPTSFFKISTSEEILRGLMYFMQQEGIVAQNTISESLDSNAKNRLFFLWVDSEDEEKIKAWLVNQSIDSHK